MNVTRGRVLRGARRVTSSEEPAPPTFREARDGAVGRRILGLELVARERAEGIVRRAREEATQIAENAAEDARVAEHTKLAALYLALHGADERRAERDLDNSLQLAVLLAERLLGATIALDPASIAVLAQRALAEARGARRATIEAHPRDAEALQRNLAMIDLPQGSVDVIENSALSRGSLTLHTDLGTLDAKLTPQLERLAKALRHALEQP